MKDPVRLENEVLPKYFRHSRFQSLVRQLNFYDFKKISKERVIWIYRHKLFQQGKPHLLDDLKRKPSASLVKSRTESSSRRGSGSMGQHGAGNSHSVGRPMSASGSRRGSRSVSPLCSFESGTTTPSSSDSSPSISPSRGALKRTRRQEASLSRASSSSSSLTSSESSPVPYDDAKHLVAGVTGAGMTCLETLSQAASSVGQNAPKAARLEREAAASYGSHGQEEQELEEEEGMQVSYWQPPDEEPEEEVEVQKEEEDEACWVMKTMMMRGREGGAESGFEEGMQALPDEEEIVVVTKASFAPTLAKKKGPQGHIAHPPSLPFAHGPRETSPGPEKSSLGHLGVKPLPPPSFPPSSLPPDLPPPTSYHPSREELRTWGYIQSQWSAAGQSQQQALLASLPSHCHQAWASFFLIIPPFQTHQRLIRACHRLLCSNPALAASVTEHRHALDPLGRSADSTFLLPGDAGEEEVEKLSIGTVAAGHNDRALREVLGFGLNHLVESARFLHTTEGSPAALALRECLQAWKCHMGRWL